MRPNWFWAPGLLNLRSKYLWQHQTFGQKTIMPASRNNKMVIHFYAQNLTRCNQLLRSRNVLLTWSWVAGRMIVRHDDANRIIGYSSGKHFTRMGNNSVNRTDKHYSLRNEPTATVQCKHYKVLLPATGNVAQQRQNIRRSRKLLCSFLSHNLRLKV